MTGRSPVRSGLNHGVIVPWTGHGLSDPEPALSEKLAAWEALYPSDGLL